MRTTLITICVLVGITHAQGPVKSQPLVGFIDEQGDVVTQAPPKFSEVLVLRARIVQLESQLTKVSTEGQVCNARLALTAQPQQEQATKAAMQQIEKEAGCRIEWQAIPAACRKAPDAAR